MISIGCMVAPIEISPATAPASDGRPRDFANSLETSSRPPVMLSRLRLCVVIVLASVDVEKGESRLAVAHGQIEAFARRKLLDYELLERRAQRRR